MPYDKNVFLNCPFDNQYAPILQAIIFTIIFQGFHPRLALESSDSSELRLTKITALIGESKYSIHDLSRCVCSKKGEYYRLNMPFELGMDLGAKQFCVEPHRDKKILILEEKRFESNIYISDLAGCDIEIHAGDYKKAMTKVSEWLHAEAGAERMGMVRIGAAYRTFQAWHYERQLSEGFTEDQIRTYKTKSLMEAMQEWKDNQ